MLYLNTNSASFVRRNTCRICHDHKTNSASIFVKNLPNLQKHTCRICPNLLRQKNWRPRMNTWNGPLNRPPQRRPPLAGCQAVAGWLAGWAAGWSAGWVADWLAGWLAWLAGWRAGSCEEVCVTTTILAPELKKNDTRIKKQR